MGSPPKTPPKTSPGTQIILLLAAVWSLVSLTFVPVHGSRAQFKTSECLAWALLTATVQILRLLNRKRTQRSTEVLLGSDNWDVIQDSTSRQDRHAVLETVIAGAIVVSATCQYESKIGWITVSTLEVVKLQRD